jgi:hypothetical protein
LLLSSGTPPKRLGAAWGSAGRSTKRRSKWRGAGVLSTAPSMSTGKSSKCSSGNPVMPKRRLLSLAPLSRTRGNAAHGDHRQSRGVPARAGPSTPAGRAPHGKGRAAGKRAEPPALQRKAQSVSRRQDNGRSTAILSSSWFRAQPPPRLLPARGGLTGGQRGDPATMGPSLGGAHGPVAGGRTGVTAGLLAPDGESLLHTHPHPCMPQ